MSDTPEQRNKLFSSGDEFEFKRRFVIELLAIQAMQGGGVNIEAALAMADRVWNEVVEHGINE